MTIIEAYESASPFKFRYHVYSYADMPIFRPVKLLASFLSTRQQKEYFSLCSQDQLITLFNFIERLENHQILSREQTIDYLYCIRRKGIYSDKRASDNIALGMSIQDVIAINQDKFKKSCGLGNTDKGCYLQIVAITIGRSPAWWSVLADNFSGLNDNAHPEVLNYLKRKYKIYEAGLNVRNLIAALNDLTQLSFQEISDEITNFQNKGYFPAIRLKNLPIVQ